MRAARCALDLVHRLVSPSSGRRSCRRAAVASNSSSRRWARLGAASQIACSSTIAIAIGAGVQVEHELGADRGGQHDVGVVGDRADRRVGDRHDRQPGGPGLADGVQRLTRITGQHDRQHGSRAGRAGLIQPVGEHGCRRRRAPARRGAPWRRSSRSRRPAAPRRAGRAPAAAGWRRAAGRRRRRDRSPRAGRPAGGGVSASAAYRPLHVRCPASVAEAPFAPSAPFASSRSSPPQRRVAVVAERHGEPGHRRLADPGQLGHLGRGEVGRGVGVLHQAVRDAALGRRQADPPEQVQHANTVIHTVTLCMKSFRSNGLTYAW